MTLKNFMEIYLPRYNDLVDIYNKYDTFLDLIDLHICDLHRLDVQICSAVGIHLIKDILKDLNIKNDQLFDYWWEDFICIDSENIYLYRRDIVDIIYSINPDFDISDLDNLIVDNLKQYNRNIYIVYDR